MVVVSRARQGVYGLGAGHPTPMTAFAPNARTVAQAQQAAVGWYEVRPMRGLGAVDMSSIPSWLPWAAGGLVLGAAVGFFLKK